MSKINIVGKTTYPKDQITKGIINIIKGRLMAIKEELISIEKDLTNFKSKYNFDENEFLQKFNGGELGDNEDFFIWEGSLKLYEKLKIEDIYRPAEEILSIHQAILYCLRFHLLYKLRLTSATVAVHF